MSFRFKKFSIEDDCSTMKVGTDSVLLGCWMSIDKNSTSYLEVGVGCGVISLIVAQRTSEIANILALDIDSESVVEANRNFQNSSWSDKLLAVHISFQEFASKHSEDVKLDSIFTNPPYFTNSLKAPTERRSGARHNDFLPFIDILKGAKSLLKTNGTLSLILPVQDALIFKKLADNEGFDLVRDCLVSTKDGEDPTREMMEFKVVCGDKNYPFQQEYLTIIKESDFTQEYKSLTRDFYLKF